MPIATAPPPAQFVTAKTSPNIAKRPQGPAESPDPQSPCNVVVDTLPVFSSQPIKSNHHSIDTCEVPTVCLVLELDVSDAVVNKQDKLMFSREWTGIYKLCKELRSARSDTEGAMWRRVCRTEHPASPVEKPRLHNENEPAGGEGSEKACHLHPPSASLDATLRARSQPGRGDHRPNPSALPGITSG